MTQLPTIGTTPRLSMTATPPVSLSLNNLIDFPMYETMRDDLAGELPFVEILWDNYCHLEPEEIQRFVAPFSSRLSIHIMMSKWMQRDADELDSFLRRVAHHVRVLKPVRVSDHVARFRVGKLNAPDPLEHDYRDVDRTVELVHRYQDAIERPLLLENFASTDASGARQIDFVLTVAHRTGCGILFDVSNAVVGELNGIVPVSAWLSALRGRAIDLHIGSYSQRSDGGGWCDSHDRAISVQTERALSKVLRSSRVQSICLEREYDKSVDALKDDLRRLRALAAASRQAAPVRHVEAAP